MITSASRNEPPGWAMADTPWATAASTPSRKGKKPSAAFSVFVVLFYVAKLFRDFRHWEINPAILDYCFSLFAMIAFMLASYHAGAFSFDRGARRRLAYRRCTISIRNPLR